MASASEEAFALTVSGGREDAEVVFSYASTAETGAEKGITSITDMQALFTKLSSGVPVPVAGEIPAAGIEETDVHRKDHLDAGG